MKPNLVREFWGEFIGTFILVLFGCGAVAGAVIFQAFSSLFEVALIWGVGVTLAIFSARNLSPAHLNPAVSLAMVLVGKLSLKRLPLYFAAQWFGAMLAALCLYGLLTDSLTHYELTHHITRGTAASIQTAQVFGEFFPNPGFIKTVKINSFQALLAEAFGTFLLVFMIFRLTEKEEQLDNTTPFFIGLTVTAIICLIAPFTQAGLNPARDFGPRLVAYFMGWQGAAFPSVPFSFFTVYIFWPFGWGCCCGSFKKGKNYLNQIG